MAKNADLSAAKTAKKDEFYTQLTDIEKEMRYYRKHFHGKTVLCNCDDPFESNFFKFFVLNFNRLGLKKLIATCYATSPIMGSQLLFYVGNDGQLSFSSNMPEEFLTKYRKQGGTGHYTKGMKMLCYYDNNGKAKIPFSRILIRNKHPEPPKGGHQ